MLKGVTRLGKVVVMYYFFYLYVKGVGCVMVDNEGDKGEGDFDNEWERW